LNKVIVTFIAVLFLNITNAFAAPVNDLENGDTAVGVISGSNNSMYYVETKSSDKLILGMQSLDLRTSNSATDFYAQIKMDDTLRVIFGNRMIDSRSKAYLGGVVESRLNPDVNGYASVIAGNGFQELQMGVNYKLTDANDININFSSLSDNKSSLGIGLSYKF
jgi:hypothetical protein